jgi:hypothetical protein
MTPAALKRALRWVDHRVGRLSGRRRVLFDIRTPMNLAVVRPVLVALLADSRVRCLVTSEETRDREWLESAGPGPVVNRRRARWARFDLYVNADPWATMRLYRCARRLNFFHGVAGKYDLDSPTRLPIAFGRYDRIAFINEDRLRRYVAAGVIPPAKAVLIGYPKIDALARGEVDGAAVRRQLGLAPGRPTALFAPTFSPVSALHLAGERIVRTLLDAGWNVIVKLHDRSMVPTEKYTAGVNWPAVFRNVADGDRYVFAETGDPTPLLAAADIMVTDHSTIGFEFLLLDRPLLIFDAPDLGRAARINPEKVALLRSAGTVVSTLEELRLAASGALRDPGALSAVRQRVAGEIFHDPGRATERAVRLIYELLELSAETNAAGAVAPAAAA